MVSNSSPNRRLDTLFEKLDAVSTSEEVIVRSEEDKERYESLLMFAFRKLQAARHHLENIRRFNELTLQELNDSAAREITQSKSGPQLGDVKVRLVVQRSANAYAFELSACLTAIKSSLDFIAMVSALHFSGVDADSIRTLIRLVEKQGKTGPVLDEVAKKLAWLKELREYRHHLVHRLCLVLTSGWVMETVKGQAVKQCCPVVVPQSTPKFVADTRRARMMDRDSTLGINEMRSESWVKYSDGTEELLEYSTSYEAATGFLRVDELMLYHISELEDFFEKVVSRLIDLDFKLASLKQRQH